MGSDKVNAQWDADKQAGKTAEGVLRALATVNAVSSDGRDVRCPACGKEARVGSKFKIFPDGVWQHFSSEMCRGDAFEILTKQGVSFSDAVRHLAGKPTKGNLPKVENLPAVAVDSFTAAVDPEVLNAVLTYGRKTGGVDAAVQFYGQWHISEEAVRNSGAVMITDPRHFSTAIVKRFGEDRLVRCGLFSPGRTGARSLIGENFPVVEPHLHPGTGVPVYFQLRASSEQYERYLAHKAGQRPYAGSEKFLSLRGTPKDAQIGAGLASVARSPHGSTVYVVEGFKDTLAAESFGVVAYGVAGTGFRPPDVALSLLRDRDVVLAFDGDEAGQAGAAKLQTWLEQQGVTSRLYALTGGMDITDRLVAKKLAEGCRCAACQDLAARTLVTAT